MTVVDRNYYYLPIDAHSYDRVSNKEFYKIHLKEEVEVGQVLDVFIPFKGTFVTPDVRGFFFASIDEDSSEPE